MKILTTLITILFLCSNIYAAVPAAPGNIRFIDLLNYDNSPFGMHPAHITPSTTNYNEALDMGVSWHRPSRYMQWADVQPDISSNDLDFSMFDYYYRNVPDSIKILGNIDVETKQTDTHRITGSRLPVDEAKYLAFVKAGVERYDGDGINDMPGLTNPVTVWQVGNEPNDRSNLTDFAQFQLMTYNAIKEACPECTVLIGGVAQPTSPMGFFVDKEAYFSEFDKKYEPILAELDGKGFDVFDFHWYGNADGDYKRLKPVYDELKVRLAAYGYEDVPVWVTEMGAYSGEPAHQAYDYQTEKQHASDYLKRFIFPLSIGIEKIFPAFGIIEGFKNTDGYFDHTGFIYNGKDNSDLGYGVKKLAYYTYKLMTDKLEGSDWDNIETVINGVNGIYACKFKNRGESIWVVWSDNNGAQTVSLSNLGITGSVKVTEAVPKFEAGQQVPDYSTAFNTYDAIESISISDVPVFVERN